MSPAAIIFDFDGVIADSEVRANRTLAESLTAIGLPTTYEECLRDYCGHNWQETERRIVQRFGRPLPADFREQHRARAQIRFAEGFAPVPGALAFLDTLGDQPRAIASGSRIISGGMSTAPTAGNAGSRTPTFTSPRRRGSASIPRPASRSRIRRSAPARRSRRG